MQREVTFRNKFRSMDVRLFRSCSWQLAFQILKLGVRDGFFKPKRSTSVSDISVCDLKQPQPSWAGCGTGGPWAGPPGNPALGGEGTERFHIIPSYPLLPVVSVKGHALSVVPNWTQTLPRTLQGQSSSQAGDHRGPSLQPFHFHLPQNTEY